MWIRCGWMYSVCQCVRRSQGANSGKKTTRRSEYGLENRDKREEEANAGETLAYPHAGHDVEVVVSNPHEHAVDAVVLAINQQPREHNAVLGVHSTVGDPVPERAIV